MLRFICSKCKTFDGVSLILPALNIAGMVIIYFWSLERTITPENFYYQPILLKIFVYVNLPSVLFTGILFASISSQGTNGEWTPTLTVIYYVVLILISCLQWLLIGKIGSMLWANIRFGKSDSI